MFVRCCVKDRAAYLGVISPRLFLSWCIFKGASSQGSQPEQSEGPPLGVLVPDPLKAKEREEGKRQEKEGRDEKVKGGGEGRGPAGGLVDDREKILVFLQPLGPGIQDVTEPSTWSPQGCSCSFLGLKMGRVWAWLSRRRCLS